MSTVHDDRPDGMYECHGDPVFGTPCGTCVPIDAVRYRSLVDKNFYVTVDDAAQYRYILLNEAGLAENTDRVARHGEPVQEPLK